MLILQNTSLLEKRDVDELEGNTDTRKLFLEQGTLEEKKAKELAEYIDAKNKEVIETNSISFVAKAMKVSKACWTTRMTVRMSSKLKRKWQLCIARSDSLLPNEREAICDKSVCFAF